MKEWHNTGADPGFQVRGGGGAHLKKLRRAEGGAKIFGVFVWKITILRQKIIFFSIAEGGAKIFEVFRVKNHDFTQNFFFFPILGGRAPGAPPPWIRPYNKITNKIIYYSLPLGDNEREITVFGKDKI